ncbi:GNAT family N-acetyltransferase [Gordonia sp. HY002]|uniref:GNAT family N-acetyltransferase n=1 Tax=Gordonia zhenghanii TaxID=2911516 RepID=UPI001EF061DE|nr:GNAT family N-acyltransferase [Gordonia zhenghanii]MCF8571399.1 GNAT family N-acetyltransferase [Gordonia zhenghanii]MCF8608003.1 GNAT family N-acetyltransferase [Gordonia zhenghanii]
MTVMSSARRTVLLSGGDYEVSITLDSYDVDAAQRLRFDVFNNEPGYSDSIGDAASGRDADRFDEYCEHLLVRHLPTDTLVGCARVLPPPRAIAAGGWYSAGEFDLAQLDPIRGETVEMGRAVVDPGHRSGSVTAMLWAALLGYLEDGGYRYMMGCVSVPLDSPIGRGRELRGIRDLAREEYRADWEAFPYLRVEVDGKSLDELDPPDKPRLPALLRGYIRLGSRVCGEPAFDEVFDVGDFLTVLDRTRGEARYVDRLRGAMARLKSAD